MKPRRSLPAETRVFDFFRSVFKIGFLERVLLAVVRRAPYGSTLTKLGYEPQKLDIA